MAFFSFGKKDKKPAEAPASEAKAQPTPPKVQNPPASGTLPPVKPPQPTGLMPANISAPGAITTQPMGMVRPGAPGLKPPRPGAGTRSTQRIVLPTPPGAKGSQTRSLPGGGPNANGRINLPAGMILRCLPAEVLASDLAEFEANGSAATEIGLPMNMILSQLPSGKVEMPLQDLVPHFPPGFLQPTEAIGNYLQTIINLPLMDVVMRIPPDLLALRPDQKEVDASVINMADPFTEEILREQAEAARRQAQASPNIIEESQAPQEEFVPSHQTVPVKSIAPPRRPAVEPLNPSRTAATTLATPPSQTARPPAATRPANSPTPMPLHQQLSISAPIKPIAAAPPPPMATTPIPAAVPAAPPPPFATGAVPPAPPPPFASAPLPTPIPVPSRSNNPLPTPVPFATPAAELSEPEPAASTPPSTSSTAPVPPVPRHTGPIPAPPPPRHTTSLPQISRRTGAVPTFGGAAPEPTPDATAEAVAAGAPDAGADELQRLAALAMAEIGDSSEETEAKAEEPAPAPEPTPAPAPFTPPKPAATPIPAAALNDPSAFIVTPAPAAPAFVPAPLPAIVRQPMPSAPQKSLSTKTGPIHMTTPEGEAVVAFNINTCTAEDLVTHIEGVPSSLADAIVKHRQKIGGLKKIEDLLDVPGMTNAVYTNLTGEQPPSKAPAQSVNELLGFPAGQNVSLKDVTDRISCWPDVTGCLLSQANGLSLVGSAPAGIDKEAIVAFVPRMFESINKSFSEVAGMETDALLLPTLGNSFHLFRNGDLYLIIMCRLPQMPERHMKVARMVLAGLSSRRE